MGPPHELIDYATDLDRTTSVTSFECAAQLRLKTVATVDEICPLLDGRVSRSAIYEQLRAGTFIVAPVRLGRRLFVPVAPLLRALGLEEVEAVR